MANSNINRTGMSYYIVIIIIIPLLILTGVLWRFFTVGNNTVREKRVELESEKLASYVERDLDQRLLALQRLADRWVAAGGTKQEQFEKDAGNYIVDMPGLQALEWVDETYHVRWVVPYAGNEQAKDLDLAFEERRYVALEKAKLSSDPTVTSVIDLVQGGKGFLIYYPLYVKGEFDGFVLAVFKITEWLDSVFFNSESDDEINNFKASILFDNETIYSQQGWDDVSEKAREFKKTRRIQILGKNISIVTRPTDNFMKETFSLLPNIVASFGVIMSVMVAFSMFLFLKTSNETFKLNITKSNLQNEILERKEIEEKLYNASARLELAARAGRIGVWSWDVISNKLTWDNQMYQLYETSDEMPLNFDVWKNSLHPDDLERSVELIQNAVKGTAVFDTEFRLKFNDNRLKYVHAAAKVERDQNGKAINMIGVNWDISQLKKTERMLKKQAELQELLVKISSLYISMPLEKVETGIQSALGEIGVYVKADRVYVFEYDFDALTTSNTYEWCQKDVVPQKEKLQSVNLNKISPLLNSHLNHKVMGIQNVDDMENEELKEFLQMQNIKTLVTVPMVNEGKLFGFIGFDWVRTEYKYSSEELQLLEIFSQILINIQLRKKSENELVESKNRYDLAIKGTNAGLWDWHVQTGETVFNERWADIIGYTLQELEPINIDTWLRYCHPEDLQESDKRLKEHFKTKQGFYDFECRMKHKNGQWIWVHDRGQVVEWSENGKPLRMLGTHIDVTQRKEAEDMIKHLANHDPLTDLPTLRLAKDRAYVSIQMAKRNNEMTAFLFIDLDGFKAVNDTYGHDAGDEVLVKVGERFIRTVRQVDTVARIGGDEFLIILNEIDNIEDIEKIAKSILKEIDKPLIIKDIQADIGASIGISVYPRDGLKVEELIKKADTAMYEIKKSGKNNFTFV